ncbi:LacI family DNA-binding transcriptional regulator [Mycolicibacterium komossense]|uniref:LacI family DNA-binding transcriptional regulator n=1 Tax=Mycolicibacterium komossense TaxID=1779 RepID=A0ABT3CCB8_9MYCO|nr:LacI family DNA-binding transcriptional regulator [Mycolicibacterium komossense]MCV7227051.1 LacI family DNA-binding transcriptional regulator [Mycolicibacterium komossense]
MPVSIADVAQCAGVSRTTVSHVLSGNRPVSEEVANRVRAAMTELGYVPSRTARNLARGSTQTVGLLVPDISNSFFADLAKGVEAACIENGFNVLLCNTGWNREREVFYLETLRSRAVDGVLYASGATPAASTLAELLAGLPVVAVDEALPGVTVSSVSSDNRQGGRAAAEHLLSLGHRSAAVIGVNSELASSAERLDGFQRQWKKATGQRAMVIEGSFDEDSGARAARDLIPAIRAREVTAIFATNDLNALGAMTILREAGIGVPHECSVIGFDDFIAARHAFPPLTTIRQDATLMGTKAAQALLTQLSGEGARRHTVLPVELVVRSSTAESPSAQ